jgi:hypothetical protein
MMAGKLVKLYTVILVPSLWVFALDGHVPTAVVAAAVAAVCSTLLRPYLSYVQHYR